MYRVKLSLLLEYCGMDSTFGVNLTLVKMGKFFKILNLSVLFVLLSLASTEGARTLNIGFPPSDAHLSSSSSGADSCTTNEGLPGTCVLQYECPAKRTSNGGRTVAPTI
ncbi:hypothetical protein GQR58_006160 [Nymphon striatum]|nr:hypothetical protein GQR58_006160 [Nymphon striatum]